MPVTKWRIDRIGRVAITLSVLCVVPLTLNSRLDAQQPSPDLEIVSPADGSNFTPGQTLTASVQVAQGKSFVAVALLAGDLGISIRTSPPFTFSLVVPDRIAGPETLTALGITTPGNGEFSKPVSIDIESQTPATALSVNFAFINFKYVGQQFFLSVVGKFDDGSSLDVSRSSETTYVADKGGIVAVSRDGVVTAVGSGATVLTVGYGGQSVTIPVSVPKVIRGDLDGDGDVDREDLNFILRALNTPASKPFDARDLNKDGVINALDARILVTLCTRPGCATH